MKINCKYFVKFHSFSEPQYLSPLQPSFQLYYSTLGCVYLYLASLPCCLNRNDADTVSFPEWTASNDSLGVKQWTIFLSCTTTHTSKYLQLFMWFVWHISLWPTKLHFELNHLLVSKIESIRQELKQFARNETNQGLTFHILFAQCCRATMFRNLFLLMSATDACRLCVSQITHKSRPKEQSNDLFKFLFRNIH